jgi:phosphoglycerol geranylgeranyltransferase
LNVLLPTTLRGLAQVLPAGCRNFTSTAKQPSTAMPTTTMLDQLSDDRRRGRRRFAVLVDPDESDERACLRTGRLAAENGVDFLLVGGSLVVEDQLDACVRALRQASGLPVVLFPGSIRQISPSADALLLLSLISGRNADLLIGQHVLAAPYLKRSGLELLPTGYLLIDGGAPTTVSYISGTQPIPRDKPGIAATTALAGEQLGLRLIYLDAGSGARYAIPPETIQAVRQTVDLPLIVGGGIRNPEAAARAAQAGADVVVVGNALEQDPGLVRELSLAVHGAQAAMPSGPSPGRPARRAGGPEKP